MGDRIGCQASMIQTYQVQYWYRLDTPTIPFLHFHFRLAVQCSLKHFLIVVNISVMAKIPSNP
jgi:hypothetical protein